MQLKPRVRLQQQNRVRRCAEQSDAYAFFNLLTSPDLLDQVESLLPEHRERLFPLTETLSMFLSQALSTDRSCQRAVNEAAVKRLIADLTPVSTHTGAYCRARMRLPQTMLSNLVQVTGRMIGDRAPSSWRLPRSSRSARRWHHGSVAGHRRKPSPISPATQSGDGVGFSAVPVSRTCLSGERRLIERCPRSFSG